MKVLPHINLNAFQDIHYGRYKCSGDKQIYGYGNSPLLAYVDWLVKNSRRTRIPRYGIWNKQSCRQRFPWYAPYKKGTNMFMMHQGIVRQIYDYDYNTDELILRG